MISENFGRLHAMIEGKRHVTGHLDRLIARDQGGECDDAAIPRAKPRAFPHVTEQTALGVFVERGSNHSNLLTAQH